MTEDQSARLECLHLASHACGQDVSFEYVLSCARKYYDFVLGKKADLKIVSNNDEG